jgi:hypothetical protein
MNIIHECSAQCANNVLRWPFRITGLTKFLGGLLILVVLGTTVQAVQSVTLTWEKSADPTVVGYNVHYGVACRTYTNSIDVGNATNATISGLVEGVTYYFAATAYNTLGLESDYSNEAGCAVPTVIPGVQIRVAPAGQFVLTVTGTIGNMYDIQATQDFITWTVIGTATMGASGSLDFTDTNAASFSKRFYRTQG